MKLFKKLVATVALVGMATVPVFAASSVSVNFEAYDLGDIDEQDGWTSDGAAGSGCATYDHAVSSSLGTAGFAAQSLRISNAVTSGCFGDQTFSKPLSDAVGETGAGAGIYSVGTLQPYFETSFDIASTAPGSQQPGLFMSVSPDRGDGSRMSYLGFGDVAGGIEITFFDVQGSSDPANFVPTVLGTFPRNVVHNVKLTLHTLDGDSNDVVNVYIDGVLEHTGTSWENYYRFDAEASAEPNVRAVRTMLFRTGGAAAPATVGSGFLVDNLSLSSGPIPPVLVGPATDKGQCKKGGWVSFNNPAYKNQGDCVSAVASQGKAKGNPIANFLSSIF